MDDLWQRYRGFFTPVLIGLGVFLVGLIVVHVITDDPDQIGKSVKSEATALARKVDPSKKTRNLRANRNAMETRVRDWALRVDQAHLEPPLEHVVGEALRAAILRGADPAELGTAIASPEASSSQVVLEPFDGDAVAAGKALVRFEQLRAERLNLLLTGDPNIGFSRLLSDVASELRVRANRADVELKAEDAGFGGVTSVSRAVLAQRLLNLARVAQLVDLAIRSGVRSILEVRLEQRANPLGEEVFLREWPFTMTLRGDMASLRPILSLLTDPANPIPLTHLALTTPPRSSPLEGQVQLNFTAASVIVRPDASLALDMEER